MMMTRSKLIVIYGRNASEKPKKYLGQPLLVGLLMTYATIIS